jgi:histidine triad (HIT) family protein
MHNHEPPGYRCPFCRAWRDGESDLPLEIVARYDDVFVLVNPRWWPNNPCACLVVPVAHHENLYDLPVQLGTPIARAARDTAIALKAAFGCDGVSTRQHNEPAGNQDVWHYHLHVFPRWEGDDLYRSGPPAWAPAEVMAERAALLRAAWPVSPGLGGGGS